MRGKRASVQVLTALNGITPAHAGKTLQRKKRMTFDEDHPRGCGENVNSPVPLGMGTGSPPRMRGKPVARDMAVMRLGITPADAGKTHSSILTYCR